MYIQVQAVSLESYADYFHTIQAVSPESYADYFHTKLRRLFSFHPYHTISIPWKHFIPEVIFCSIVKYTTKEARGRGDTNFSLTLSKLEAFIALQYGKDL